MNKPAAATAGVHGVLGRRTRVDLSDHDAVARAVNAHLPDATVVATDGHDWVADPFSKGTWLSIPPDLVLRRHLRCALESPRAG